MTQTYSKYPEYCCERAQYQAGLGPAPALCHRGTGGTAGQIEEAAGQSKGESGGWVRNTCGLACPTRMCIGDAAADDVRQNDAAEEHITKIPLFHIYKLRKQVTGAVGHQSNDNRSCRRYCSDRSPSCTTILCLATRRTGSRLGLGGKPRGWEWQLGVLPLWQIDPMSMRCRRLGRVRNYECALATPDFVSVKDPHTSHRDVAASRDCSADPPSTDGRARRLWPTVQVFRLGDETLAAQVRAARVQADE